MPICIVKESGLCPECSKLGRKQNNEDNRVLDLSLLCKKCKAKLKTSYVAVVKEPRKYWAPDE